MSFPRPARHRFAQAKQAGSGNLYLQSKIPDQVRNDSMSLLYQARRAMQKVRFYATSFEAKRKPASCGRHKMPVLVFGLSQ
jgi:hypothetical protein